MKSPWGFCFLWTEVSPWTTCLLPNPLLHNMTYILYGCHVLPRSSCRPAKKVISNAWDALWGKYWIETEFQRATVGKDELLVHFFPTRSWIPPLLQSHVSCLLYLKLCWKHPTGNIFCSCTTWDLARNQMDVLPSGRIGQWCHWNSEGAF